MPTQTSGSSLGPIPHPASLVPPARGERGPRDFENLKSNDLLRRLNSTSRSGIWVLAPNFGALPTKLSNTARQYFSPFFGIK
ncbi:hypothetical protein JMJ77_0007984 [Colletotrichum scovillei]|uniref:Uncharacterized protein n=1 Tax=Colletotrichum scovillei TaxID=1209932 RepID=A0A9P7RG40_9PEZI|nr:hypothetical protein JMJ77_0007984 [Colletotrichum scovillei]KAG7074962.1 hypothetical protein JMJ76_0011427 [Colletotrichum scovillei]KAG7082027.1 hypothetical protein JMJ78_0004134 [Colletotrichum scovillei]